MINQLSRKKLTIVLISMNTAHQSPMVSELKVVIYMLRDSAFTLGFAIEEWNLLFCYYFLRSSCLKSFPL